MQHQDPQFKAFDERLKILETSSAPDLQQRLEFLLTEIEQFAAAVKEKQIEACRAIGFLAGMQYAELNINSQLLPLQNRIQALLAKLTPPPLPDPELNEFDNRLKIFEKGLSDPSPAMLQALQEDLDRYEIDSPQPNVQSLLLLRGRLLELFTKLMLPALPSVSVKIPSNALHKDGSAPILKSQEVKSNNTIRHIALLGSLGLFGYMAFKNAPSEWLDYLADSIRPKQH